MLSGMITPQPIVPPDAVQKLIDGSTAQGILWAQLMARIIWSGLLPYFPYVMVVLFIWLILASINAFMGRTGMLGSLLYHIFYFGILGIIVWINGFGILFNPYLDLIDLILYLVCYFLTGLVLDKFRHHY